ATSCAGAASESKPNRSRIRRSRTNMPEDKDNKRVARDAFEREIATDLDEDTPDKPKGLPLHTKILIGLAVGVIAGVAVNRQWGGDHPGVVSVVDNFTQPVGQL